MMLRHAIAAVVVLSSVASAEVVHDAARGFSFVIPEGYEPMAEAPAGTLYAYVRGTPGTESYGLFTISGLGGTLGRGTKLDHATVERSANQASGKSGVKMSGFEYRTTTWGEFTLDTVVSHAKGPGGEAVTFATQVPLAKEAIQVVFAGPKAELALVTKEHTAVIHSIEGKSSWLSAFERGEQLGEGIGRIIVGVGCGCVCPLSIGGLIWFLMKRRKAKA